MLRPAAMQPGTGLNCAPAAVPMISLLALLKSQHAAAESVCSQWPLTCCCTLLNAVSIVAQALGTQLEVGARPHASKGCCWREGRGRSRSSCRCPMLVGHRDSIAARRCGLFKRSLLRKKGGDHEQLVKAACHPL